MHPAASIEVQTHRRLRARIHVEPHPAMPELTVLVFTDADAEARVELSLSPENADRLCELLTERLDAIRSTGLMDVVA